MSATDNMKCDPVADSGVEAQTSRPMTKRRIEAYGSKGFKNVIWRRTFPSVEKLLAWCEKHDATVIGTRDVE
jgi:hypothetical protein